MNIDAIAAKEQRFVIGVAGGASSSGVKAALVRIKGSGPDMAVKHIETHRIDYGAGLRTRLLAPRVDSRELAILNFELGERFADVVQELLEVAREGGVDVDLIASNGHTMAHVPPRGDGARGTLTLGESAVIAERTGVPVVSNFRACDMAAGGQGAPLAGYAHWLLFHRPDRTAAVLNLGGVAGLTVVPPALDEVIAFETGPGTIAIDGAVRLLTAGTQETDSKGKAASRGVVIDEFLEYLLDHPYFGRVPPKSTSREEFSPDNYLRDALSARKGHSFDDLVATCTAAVAYSIMRAYNRFVQNNYDVSRLIAIGGGIHNDALMKQIKQAVPDVTLRTSEDYRLPGDAIGCISVAVLGNEAVCGVPANLPRATGARHQRILGSFTPA